MYAQTKILLENGAVLEIIDDRVLCSDAAQQPVHLTPAAECILKVLAENLNTRVASPALYAAYTNESDCALRDVGQYVSKVIYTFPPTIRACIDNARGKGYLLKGQKVPAMQEPEKQEPSSEACILKSTHLQIKPVFVTDQKREQLFDDIDTLFSQGHRSVFLRGFGGIGKSEFAKQYARRKLEDRTYTTVIFAPIDVRKGNVNLQTLICDDVIFSITNFPKRNHTVALSGSGNMVRQSESPEAYFERKFAKIREICDRETLIILDNFDVAYDREIIRFLEGNYHVIVTTRYHFPDIACPQIEMGYLDQKGLTELFFKNSHRTNISADDPALMRIFELLGRHTMAIELLAKYMAEDDMVSVGEILSQLQERGSLANLDGSVQISSADEERRPFDYITALFDVSSLQNDRHSRDFETLLACMSLMPLSGVKKYDFLKWCGIKSAAALNKLIRRSWIFEDYRDEIPWISMHSVVAEVMRHQFRPDFDRCGELITSLYAIAEHGYHQTLEEVSYLSSIIRRILYFCPVKDLKHYEKYLCFSSYFAIREETEIAAEILSSLHSYADAHHVADPCFYGHLCEGYGVYYSYLRRFEDSVTWRRKSLRFYQQTGKHPDRIREVKREIAWCYIQMQDLPNALAAAEEVDTWIQEADNGTRGHGAMLHLKARLEYEQGHYGSAIMYDTKALEIFKALNLGMDCGSAYHVLGMSHCRSPETFDLGISQLKKCLTLWQKHRTAFSRNMVDIHQMIADAYFDNQRFDDALAWYRKCIQILGNQAAEIHTDTIRRMILSKIAACRENAGNGSSPYHD